MLIIDSFTLVLAVKHYFSTLTPTLMINYWAYFKILFSDAHFFQKTINLLEKPSILLLFLFSKTKALLCISTEGRISAVPPSFASEHTYYSNASCPLTGTNRNHLLLHSQNATFGDSVQKLPSISRSSKRLSAGGRFSLGSLVMYSSFSLPLSLLMHLSYFRNQNLSR